MKSNDFARFNCLLKINFHFKLLQSIFDLVQINSEFQIMLKNRFHCFKIQFYSHLIFFFFINKLTSIRNYFAQTIKMFLLFIFN
jgi:hypothetical protein